MKEPRAEKAQRLVDEGKVRIIQNWNDGIEAEVQQKRLPYHTIVYASGSFFCTCDWGQHHSYTDDLCAHALAVKLAVKEKP